MFQHVSSPRIKPAVIFFAVLFFILFSAWSAAAENRTIAILPFAVHGSDDHRHMERAAADMLSARLGRDAGYEPVSASRIRALDIDPAQTDLDAALSAGRELDADAVLFGSITMIGEAWSMDGTLVSVESGRRIDSFSFSGEDGSALIDGIGDMAAEVRGALEAGESPDRAATRLTVPPGGDGRGRPAEPGAPAAGFQVAEPTRADVPGTWSGPVLEKNLVGIAASDLTGDGKNETVLLADDAVYIYSLAGREFTFLETIGAPSNTVCMAVDVADINGNGRAEIFVTASNSRGDSLRSFVLEYRDGGYEIIKEASPWFYRVIRDRDGTAKLLGQRHRMETDPFDSEIVRLIFDNGGYRPEETYIPRGSGINALGVDSGEDSGIVAYNGGRHLRILGPDGRKSWTSRREYGGLNRYMNGARTGRGDAPERYYLPGRVIVSYDLGGEGRAERIFVFRNTDPSPVRLQRLRTYSDGEIVSLARDGAELREEWKTREYDGHFRDIFLADFTGDGRMELAALLMEKQGWNIFSSPQSRVLIFPMHAGDDQE